MSELFPCPNPACTNWNPLGRAKCFRCGTSLDPAQGESDEMTGGGNAKMWVAVVLGGVLLLGLGGYFALEWNDRRTDEVKPVINLEGVTGGRVRTSASTLVLKGTVTDAHPDKLDADGQSHDVGKDGKFEIEVPVTAGERQLKLVARDKRGNESSPVELTVSQDAAPPTFVTLAPVDGSTAAVKTITVSGTASEDLATATVGARSATVAGAEFTVEVALQPGANELAVRLKDLAGNEATKTLRVTLEERALPEGVTPDAGAFLAAKDGSRMVIIPDGTFRMGNDSGDADEQPTHDVRVSAFLMDVTPVTNAQYAKFMAEAGHPAPPPPEFDRNYMTAQPDSPVVNVSWDDARLYAEWAGRRLPTEAEWERAARGDDRRMHPWGNEPPDATRANTDGAGDGYANTSPVGKYPAGASPFGVLDMAGNVWQWTLDFYDPGYYGQSSGATDPQGPERGTQFVLRGGAFTSKPGDVRSTNRYARGPDERARNVGFRTVADFPGGS